MPRRLTDNMYNIPELLRLYRAAHLEVMERLEKAKTEASVIRQRALMGEINQILGRTASETQRWANANVPEIYRDGANDAVRELSKMQASIKVAEGFSTVHQQAIAAMTSETYLSFANALRTVGNQAQGTLDQVAKLRIRDEIAKGTIEGIPRREISKNVTEVIKERGVIALQDRSGKNWQLDTYAQMLVRTKQKEAYNAGTSNRLLENGYDLVQISSHGATDSCAEWEGEIISLTGATKGYPTLADVESDGTHMFGVNCRHTFAAYIPSLAESE